MNDPDRSCFMTDSALDVRLDEVDPALLAESE